MISFLLFYFPVFLWRYKIEAVFSFFPGFFQIYRRFGVTAGQADFQEQFNEASFGILVS
jgi:hypothetical protein